MHRINEKIVASFENILFLQNKIWFTENGCNKLYNYSLEDESVKCFCEISTEEEFGDRLFGDILYIKGDLYLIPFNAKKMYKVNLISKQIKAIELAGNDLPENAISFLSAHYFKDSIYMVSTNLPLVFEYSCVDYSVHIYDIGNLVISRTTKDVAFCRKTSRKDDKLYIPLCGKNVVAIFNLCTKEIESKIIGDEDCRYSAICFEADNWWLAPRNGNSIIKWSNKVNRFARYEEFPQEYIKGGFADILFWNNKIILVPIGANMPLMIDVENKKIKGFELLFDDPLMCAGVDRDNLVLFSERNGKMFFWDKEFKLKSMKEVVLPKQEIDFLKRKVSLLYGFGQNDYQCKDITLKENEIERFDDFIYYIKRQNDKQSIQNINENLKGKYIFKNLFNNN